MIPSPYLLYLGRMKDPGDIKTSRGLAVFRKDACIGEFRHDDCALTLSLPRMGFDEAAAAGAKTLVLGVAYAGGRLGPDLIEDALEAISAGLNVASGLHQRLRSVPRLVDAAAKAGVELFDVREPPQDIPVGNGRRRAGHRLLTVGTDCSSGKMYTTLALTKGLLERGLRADFRATGQTGILVAGCGVPLDAVVADFISGAIETLSPERSDGGWDLIEGQGSLFHPAFAGVSTGLLHGAQPDAIVMCHDPLRSHLRGFPHVPVPDIVECIDANLRVARLTNPDVAAVGVALDTSKLDEEAANRTCERIQAITGLPTTDAHRFGPDVILDNLLGRYPAGGSPR